MLTFDDGLKSVYRYALPILRNNRQQATYLLFLRGLKHSHKNGQRMTQFMNKQEIKIAETFN